MNRLKFPSACAAALFLSLFALADASQAAGGKKGGDQGNGLERLSGNEYYTLAPFVIPMMENGEHTHQATIVVALKFGEDGERDEITRLTPRIRDPMYRILFTMITYRTAKPRVPSKAAIQRRLSVVTKKIGDNLIEALLVRLVEVAPRPKL